MGGQVGERKDGALALIQIVKLEGLKITHQDVAGLVSFGQGVEVFARLPVGSRQIAARAFLLHDQDARPEEVDVAVGIVQTPYVLLIARDGAALDAEDMEKFVVKTLRLALLIRSARPCAGEPRRADAHLVPGQAHVQPQAMPGRAAAGGVLRGDAFLVIFMGRKYRTFWGMIPSRVGFEPVGQPHRVSSSPGQSRPVPTKA